MFCSLASGSLQINVPISSREPLVSLSARVCACSSVILCSPRRAERRRAGADSGRTGSCFHLGLLSGGRAGNAAASAAVRRDRHASNVICACGKNGASAATSSAAGVRALPAGSLGVRAADGVMSGLPSRRGRWGSAREDLRLSMWMSEVAISLRYCALRLLLNRHPAN